MAADPPTPATTHGRAQEVSDVRHAYADVAEARAGIGRYLAFYNDVRAHQALGYQTPAAFYRGLARDAA